MKHTQSLSVLVILGAVLLSPSILFARDLTFEDRVKAQEAIERVYYSHQLGATQPFEEAVPRQVWERKVETYLKQSAALERFWHTPVTGAMLESELERMARGSRMPERLRELFAALGDDPVLVQECLARASLADRLARSFHDFDRRFHESAATYDEWWGRVAPDLDASSVRTVAAARSALPVAPGSGTMTGSTSASDCTWDNGSLDDAPPPLQNHTAVWTGSLMVIWGGSSSSGLQGGWRYDPASDAWSPVTTVGAPSPRSSHTAVWTGSAMLVWGGLVATNTSSATGGRYDPASDTWTPISNLNAPSARSQHTAVWTGSRMIVWGGMGDAYNLLATGGRYDPVGDTWQDTTLSGAPTGRYQHTVVWTGSAMVIWGGYDGSYPSTGGRYDPVHDTWTATSTIGAPEYLQNPKAVWTGSLMVVWGYPFNVPGARYDPATDAWTPVSTVGMPDPRSEFSLVWTGSVMVLWGGYDGEQALQSGGRYDPVSDTWTPTSTAGAPTPRRRHTAVWTGGLMIVWGGASDAGTDLKPGGRYDPASDTWTPMSVSPVGAPPVSYQHTAVWTGTHMVVWGGYDGSSDMNRGSRYDPAIDAWTPTSSVNAPSPRHLHSAVWTGSRMIVWGGVNGSARIGTGARYDPASDTWTPTSQTGAPSARGTHTAVWTGSLMIVWGGGAGVAGGRYNPASDTWMPTSVVGAPLDRSWHTAIWTGSRMVIWGGHEWNGSFYSNTGGRYDPASDTWMPTSVVGAPMAVLSHTAIWTGSRMVIWGGYRGTASPYYFNSGGIYDPVGDTWQDTTLSGAPAGRSKHTAVWTGSAMVIWGGNGYARNDGGRFDPMSNTWMTLSTVRAPTQRWEHTAVWTGNFMIVWGGTEGMPYAHTGGRYLLGETDNDGDGFSECDGDCDDGNPAIHPGATDLCNGIDDNCDGQIDEGLGLTTCGVGACQRTVQNCVGGVAQTCAPGAPTSEVCNGIDDDCNGIVDDAPAPTGVPNLTVSQVGTDASMSWSTVSNTTGYDVLRGDLQSLLGSGGDFTTAIRACLANDSTATSMAATDTPPAGGGSFYLVRGINCGGNGTYDSGSSSQVGSRDSGINASPNSCP
jgi:N-acetylneuraminic acid mutarotase